MEKVQRNLAILSDNQYSQFDPMSEDDIRKAVVASEGDIDYVLELATEKVFAVRNECDLQNMPDPIREELIFVVGVGSEKELLTLAKTANPGATFIVIEPEAAFFQRLVTEWDLSLFTEYRFIFFAKKMENIGQALAELLKSSLVIFARNTRIYVSAFYRQFDPQTALAIAKMISERLLYQMRHMGNDFTDTIWGMSHDVANIRNLHGALDVDRLKGAFKGLPAVIVSAGPSLDKNIDLLHELEGKALIVAVDTILDKLLKRGIHPQAVCSIERIDEVYDYFYRGKDIPESVSFVAPPVVNPILFDTFKGDRIIPYRNPLPIYMWFKEITGVAGESTLEMGASSAHLAFGFAEHLGCSPLVLIGQDLAFANADGRLVSHTNETAYDGTGKGAADSYSSPSLEVEGYYGGQVVTSLWWQDVRLWIETRITADKLHVINATEGGAKITGAEQLPLREVVSKFSGAEKRDLSAELKSFPKNTVDFSTALAGMRSKIERIEEILRFSRKREKALRAMELNERLPEKKVHENWKFMQKTDKLLHDVIGELLLNQLIHPNIVHITQKVYALEQRVDIETLQKNRDLQLELCFVVGYACDELLPVLRKAEKELAELTK